MHRVRRFVAVAAGVGALVAAPSLAARLPVSDSDISAADLLSRVRGSATVAHTGYAESAARLNLPDVRQLGDVLELLGERTNLRVWWRGPDAWRVDAVEPAGEHGHYRDGTGFWLWDSFERRATRLTGEPQVRLVRAPDLVPSELGRRVVAYADVADATRIPARRVAGRSAPGIRITPRDPDTTVGRVDVWVHEPTGLPLRVEITARGAANPVISTQYLELRLDAPAAAVLQFRLPADAELDEAVAADIAEEVDRLSPFVVPEVVDGRARRSAIGTGAGTYGSGFAIVSVLALEDARVDRARRRLDRLQIQRIPAPFGDATPVSTPLFNGLLFTHDGIGYVIAGTVQQRVLEAVAADLAAR